ARPSSRSPSGSSQLRGARGPCLATARVPRSTSPDPGCTMTPRVTRQRTAIREALAEADEFGSAQRWHESLSRAGESIGLATVYRNLQALAETGEVDAVMTDDGQSLYRLCGDQGGHHHHLRCRVCGAAVEIEGPGV